MVIKKGPADIELNLFHNPFQLITDDTKCHDNCLHLLDQAFSEGGGWLTYRTFTAEIPVQLGSGFSQSTIMIFRGFTCFVFPSRLIVSKVMQYFGQVILWDRDGWYVDMMK